MIVVNMGLGLFLFITIFMVVEHLKYLHLI